MFLERAELITEEFAAHKSTLKGLDG